MFELNLNPLDFFGTWQAGENGWSSGESKIQPFLNPALETMAFSAPGQVLFVSRERLTKGPRRTTPASVKGVSREGLLAEFDALKDHPLDFLAILLVGEGAGSCEIRCGSWGSAPLYLVEPDDGRLYGHWHPARLFPRMRQRRPHLSMLASHLTWTAPDYQTHTHFHGLRRLTARNSAVWDTKKLEIINPPDIKLPGPSELLPGADPVTLFTDLARACVKRRVPGLGDTIACQLSGGLDSALVAGLAARSGKVRSYGLIMPGRNGRIQRTRRQAIIRTFDLDDTCLLASDWLPFVNPEREGRVPWSEYYSSSLGMTLELAVKDGATAMLTGLGGDELLPYFVNEVPAEPDAPVRPMITPLAYELAEKAPPEGPASVAQPSVMASADCCGHFFLERGLWPVHPLASPPLVRFARRLPLEWRRRRRMTRAALTSMGLPKIATHPTVTEDFSGIMDITLRRRARKKVRALFEDSRLVAFGLLDGRQLLESYDDYVDHRSAVDLTPDFFLHVARLEFCLRAFEQA